VPGKLPWLPWYSGDWLRDPDLSRAKPATRGIWMDLLMSMYESNRAFFISGTVEQLARVARCSPAEMTDAIDDLDRTNTADVTRKGDVIRVVSRRLSRAASERTKAVKRKRKQRSRDGHDPVLPPSRGRGQKSEVRDQIPTTTREGGEENAAPGPESFTRSPLDLRAGDVPDESPAPPPDEEFLANADAVPWWLHEILAKHRRNLPITKHDEERLRFFDFTDLFVELREADSPARFEPKRKGALDGD
jgi:hypothetical protein